MAAIARDAGKVKEALEIFLTPGTRPDGGRSTLDAALAEAHVALNETRILWLGALGHLIVLEAIGRTLARRPSSRFLSRGSPTDRFVAGVREFAPHAIGETKAKALYALRSSLAHSFDLRNWPYRPFCRFGLSETGPLMILASPAWNGSNRPSPPQDMKERRKFMTYVNVFEVARYTKSVVDNVRAQHANGKVTLWNDVEPEDVIAFGQFFIE